MRISRHLGIYTLLDKEKYSATFGTPGTYTGTLSAGTYQIDVYGSGGGGGGYLYGTAQSGSAGGLVSQTITLTTATPFTCTVGAGGEESDNLADYRGIKAGYCGGKTGVTIGQSEIYCNGGIPGAVWDDIDHFLYYEPFGIDGSGWESDGMFLEDLEYSLNELTGFDATQLFYSAENEISGGIDGSTTISYYDSIVSADGVQRCYGGAGSTENGENGAPGGCGFIHIHEL